MRFPKNVKKILRPFYVPIANAHYRLFRAPRRYHHLYDTIRETKASKIMEIGVWNGKRAVRMIEAAKEHAEKVSYYGYDLFEELGEEGCEVELSKMPPTEREVRELLEETGADIHIFKGNTLNTLPATVGDLPIMDFVFIDGGHSVETVANDWKHAQDVIGEHTVVIFDDYWRNRTDAGAKPVVDAIDREKYDVEILPETDVFDNPDFGRLEISFAKAKFRKLNYEK